MVKDTAGRVDAPPLSSTKVALTTAARPRFASAPLTRPHGSWSKRVTRSRLPAVSSAAVAVATAAVVVAIEVSISRGVFVTPPPPPQPPQKKQE